MIERIKEQARSVAMRLPGGKLAYRWLARRLALRRFGRMLPGLSPIADASTIFEAIYRTNAWGSTESRSGPGSTLEFTALLRRELSSLVSSLGVRTLLDAPCGDFNWMQAVRWESPIHYIGGDISPSLIDRNRAAYTGDGCTFNVLDIRHDDLPSADLWLCRDCLFHLPEHDVFAVLRNFVRHDIPWLLTSCHTDCRINTDAPTGGFRLLNLELPPYRLGPPVATIEDWVPGHARRYLALWQREQVAAVIGSCENEPGFRPVPRIGSATDRTAVSAS